MPRVDLRSRGECSGCVRSSRRRAAISTTNVFDRLNVATRRIAGPQPWEASRARGLRSAPPPAREIDPLGQLRAGGAIHGRGGARFAEERFAAIIRRDLVERFAYDGLVASVGECSTDLEDRRFVLAFAPE